MYNLNKHIANILKTYVKHENNNAKNSTRFSNYIRNVPIEDDELMVSFDVTSLYTNIPIIDTLNIIKDYVHSDDQFARKTAIPQDKFLDLVNLVLTTTWYTFNSQFYQQNDGVAMGGPASSTTAEQSKCSRRMDIRKALLVKSLRELLIITACLSYSNKRKPQKSKRKRSK